MKRIQMTKTGHLFQIIFLVLCLLLVCMLAYMTFFMNRFVFKNQIRELDSSNMRMLEQTNDSIERTVEDLEQQVHLFLSDQAVLQYLLNPKYSSTEDNMNVLQQLKDYVNLTQNVSYLWLYAPVSNTVLSSDGYLTTRVGSRADAVLDCYEGQKISRQEPDLCVSAVTWDGELYILVDFVPAARLGCFIFQIDTSRLGIVGGEGQSSILVTDDQGKCLLDGTKPSDGKLQLDLTQDKLFYTESSSQRNGQQRYYQVRNQALGWALLMEISSASELYDSSAFWKVIVPFLAVMMLLGEVGAYYITWKIYTPINRLLALVMDRSGEIARLEDDTDYLEAAYQQTLEDNKQLRAQFSLLGKDLCQYLCREAIEGRLSGYPDSESILEFMPEGTFGVAMIQPEESRVELQAPIRQKLQLSALENLAAQMPECLCCLEDGQDRLILVFRLTKLDTGQLESARLLERFRQQAAQQFQCQIFCGLGKDCDSLSQLKQSYEEALRDLQYNAYLAADPDPVTAQSLKNKELEKRLNEAIDQAIQSRDNIERQALVLEHAVQQGAPDKDARLEGYRKVRELFLEKMYFQEEAIHALPAFDGNIPGEQTREAFLEFCRQALDVSRKLVGKKKYRYVEEGKKFMQENYMDCSLSVNMISDHVGISPSYFSNLFNEQLQESVTSYLNGIRVEQAKSMLRVTRIPVKEIGFRCGFNSANVFGRVFKKYTGKSPKQFRDDYLHSQKGEDHD